MAWIMLLIFISATTTPTLPTGLASVIYTYEISLSLAQLLHRGLMLPRYLQMDTCSDAAVCKLSTCELRRGIHWCPVELFWSHDTLTRAGAVFGVDHPGLSRHVVRDAFDRMYNDKKQMWFDVLPRSLGPAHVHNHKYVPGSGQVMFEYYRYTVDCELAFGDAQEKRWNSRQPLDTARPVYGIADEYGDVDADMLVLEGRVAYMSGFPYIWSSPSAQRLFRQNVVDNMIEYHPDMTRLADVITEVMRRRTGSFIAAHVLGRSKRTRSHSDMKSERDFILTQQATLTEPIYISTRERNQETLDTLRETGALMWSDVIRLPEVKGALTQLRTASTMLGYPDYVACIEARVCAAARLFIGTRCSPYTGTILNMQLKTVHDDVFVAFPDTA